MENLLNKESVKRVEEITKQFNSEMKITVLDTSAQTSKEAANSLKCEVGAIVKSLLLKTENNFLICLVAGDKRCSLNKIKKILKKKNVCLANAKEVKENTGFSIGGVSPVGHIKKFDILIDKSLNRFTNLFAAAGHPNCVFKINYTDLIKITNGSEEEMSE
jgi:Cys-tRNA(Pro) deacylase